MTASTYPSLPKLSPTTYDTVEYELSRYRQTVTAAQQRTEVYLCLSGQDDDGTGIVAHRGKLCESDPTGNAATRMAADEELQEWRRIIGAILGVYVPLSHDWRETARLIWDARDPRGNHYTMPAVAALMGVSVRTVGLRRAVIRVWVAREMGLV